jgi:hypothetical protein
MGYSTKDRGFPWHLTILNLYRINRPAGPKEVQAISSTRDYALLLIVTIMSVAANLPGEFSLESVIDRKYLVAGLLLVVTIALVRYSRFVLVAAVSILAIGANLPQDIAESLSVDSSILLGVLVAIVLLSVVNRTLKLPTGLDRPQGSAAEHGTVALFGAISRRRVSLVRSLIKSGVSIEARSEEGLTPLMIAASQGYDAIVLLLAISGADLKAVDASGNTALDHARDGGHEHTARIIIREGVGASGNSN